MNFVSSFVSIVSEYLNLLIYLFFNKARNDTKKNRIVNFTISYNKRMDSALLMLYWEGHGIRVDFRVL